MTVEERLKNLEIKVDKLLEILQNNVLTEKQTITTDSPMLYAYIEDWLNNVKAPKIKPKSLSILRNAYVYYIKPSIEDKPLHTVRTADMIKAIDSCPYSFMRQVVYSVIRALFKRAYQYDVISVNPAEKLDFVKHTRKIGKALTHEQQATFLENIAEEPMRPLFLFYLLSGCRCQEAVTLLWSDIDIKNNRIYIRGTKTINSERYIPLFPQLAEVLSTIPHIEERIFPFTTRQVQWHFTRIRKNSGLWFRLHDLRHTFATRCLENGITIKTVAKWLGHKHTKTTEDIYSHLLTEFEKQEVTKFKIDIYS